MTEQNRMPSVGPRPDPRLLKALRTLEEAVQAQKLGRIDEADRLYTKLVKKNPGYFDALNFYGLFKYQQGKHQAALDLFKRAVAVFPRSINALNNLGIVHCHLKRTQEALRVFDQALALDPANVNSLNNRGNALLDLKQADAALASFDSAIKLQSNFCSAYVNRGRALLELERYEEALANYDRALMFVPLDAELHNNRGGVLHKLNRMDEALACFDKAIALNLNFADAYCNRGSVLRDIKRYKEAFVDFEKTLDLKPDAANAWCGLGSIFNRYRRYDAAYDAYTKALALNPAQERALAPRIHAKMQLCDWRGLDTDFAAVLSAMRKGLLVGDPFSLLCVPASPADQFQCASRFAKTTVPPTEKPLWTGERYYHDRVRIAYLSSNLCNHAVAHLIAGAFEAHNRSRFEITALSLSPVVNDQMQERLRPAFDRFLDLEAQTDKEIAEIVRALEIDILIDLNGFTLDSRTHVLAQRAAPIQVNYLGYSGTMGASYFDYIIADQTVLPPDHTPFYSEKIAWLPDSYMPCDNRRAIADRTPTRHECGLPDEAIVFCCFNQPYKHTPEVFRSWMTILKATGNSVLWLNSTNEFAEANLRQEAERSGVSPHRLIFASRVPDMADYLARQRQADLFLDTWPYNAHTTASDALWAGLPVLTRIGETFASRVAASLLQAIGLTELITISSEAYERLAIELANNPGRLAVLKQCLEANRRAMPLFDTELFTRRLEAAYLAMYERYCAGLAPDHIAVPRR